MKLHISRSRLGLVLALGALCWLSPSTGRAGLVLVNFQPGAPLVSGSNGHLTYNASSDDFNVTLTGPSLNYAAPFVLPRGFALFSGSLNIDLKVDHNGGFVANGTGLTLTGTVTINGATFTGTGGNPLLTGTITDFGSQPPGPPTIDFDGLFTITGGALTQTQTGTNHMPVFGGFPVGGSGGFLLDVENVTGGTLANFMQNFSSSSVKPEVGVVTPEPSSLTLMLTAAVAVGAPGLRRKRLLSRATR